MEAPIYWTDYIFTMPYNFWLLKGLGLVVSCWIAARLYGE